MKLHYSIIIYLILIIINYGCSTKPSWDIQLKTDLEQLADSLTTNLTEWEVPNKIFNVDDFGAIADSITINTEPIQKTIDECSAAGGGIVLFPKGNYVTGTIELKSNVMIKVAKNARILGSLSLEDYPEKIENLNSLMKEQYDFRQSLVYAENAENIGICGQGEIHFRGDKDNFPSPETIGIIVGRPLGMRIIQCNNIVIKNITLRNSAAWMQNYLFCNNLIFDNMTVKSSMNYNNDGIDLDGCNGVIVRNCYVFSADDGMCFKGTSFRPTQNILVENSTFITNCNAFKIGTDTQGDFKNIIARNLKMGGLPDSLYSIKGKQASTGVTLATVDGGNVENIYMQNLEINRSRCPIFLRIGNRGRVMKCMKKPLPGYLKNIVIENITGSDNYPQGSMISGIANHEVMNVIIRNMDIEMNGGGTVEMTNKKVAEKEGGYPDAQEFNKNGLPAYGFFIRHAENITLENVKVIPENKDERPEFKSGGNIENVIVNGKILD